tara:strand:+ start:409 stop:597 length:189 start_codon:yes stop_codon:yes gene_type:complete
MLSVFTFFGATPLRKNKENPNGGVRKLVCKFNEIKIPNHNGSSPLAIKLGPTRGIITNIISM